ncbi:MAG: cation:proton antiporter [Acidobacteria bacterium]|nr:cation:proton antiporter [Acidobacteriota bacterium]
MNPPPSNTHMESLLLLVIIQLVVIIAVARLFGQVFRRFGQPVVCGEIAAGLLLGPSLFGRFFPETFHAIFNSDVGLVFSIFSQVGLVLLMFIIGMEFDFGHLSENRRTAMSISIVGILLPFVLGFSLGYLMHPRLGLTGSPLHFSLFIAAAMSITAIPILGRIMIELNMNRTCIGSLTISAAALDDATGWVILALVTAISRSNLDPGKMALMVVGVLLYAAAMILVVRPLLCRWTARMLLANHGDLTLNVQATLLILMFLSAAVTNLIGIFSIFGGFMFGAILYDQHELREALRQRIQDFVTVFFLPIFFTYTGLRTDIGSMQSASLWVWCILVMLAAVAGKFGGCTLAGYYSGLPLREAALIGVMMNTRALMELIVINIGYDLGVIPKSVFFMLVFMAVVTTYMTTPILRRLARNTEVWDSYRASQFAARFKSKGVAATHLD